MAGANPLRNASKLLILLPGTAHPCYCYAPPGAGTDTDTDTGTGTGNQRTADHGRREHEGSGAGTMTSNGPNARDPTARAVSGTITMRGAASEGLEICR